MAVMGVDLAWLSSPFFAPSLSNLGPNEPGTFFFFIHRVAARSTDSGTPLSHAVAPRLSQRLVPILKPRIRNWKSVALDEILLPISSCSQTQTLPVPQSCLRRGEAHYHQSFVSHRYIPCIYTHEKSGKQETHSSAIFLWSAGSVGLPMRTGVNEAFFSRYLARAGR